MKKQSLYTIFTLGLAIAALLIYSAPANATATLELISGSTTITVPDTSGSGVAGYSGTVGGWNVSFGYSTGVTYPTLGSAGLPTMELNSLNFAAPTTTTPLEILFSQTGFVAPPAATLSIGGTFSGLTSLTGSAYYGATDVLFDKSNQIGSTLIFTSSPFSGSTGGHITASGDISLTEEVILTPDPGGWGSLDETLTTPEPGTLFLLGTGLLGLGVFRNRFKKA